VNQTAPAPCVATIGAAVAAASPNDQIQVAAGEYNEDVVIPMPLVITGAGPDSTIINAKGLSNGIYIDGVDNPGLMNVQISGFTIMNANYEGILVTNAAYVVITNNVVENNDQSLDYSASTCAVSRCLKPRRVTTAVKAFILSVSRFQPSATILWNSMPVVFC